MDLKGKKLLIIGGAFQHCKLVEAAHQMGVIVYVVDYLPVEKAPAKQMADFHFEYNITDYDDITDMCRREHMDGVLSSHLDACQIPYQVICERLGLPCFGTKEQFHILTDKTAFLDACRQYGVDIIPQYTENQLTDEPDTVEYPVFIKPCDSRGSRGQTVCYTKDDVPSAVRFAKSESKTGKIIAEKYMGGKQEFTMSYLMIDGEAYLVRTGDRYVGSPESKMDKSCILGISPSVNLNFFLANAHTKVVHMIQNIGIQNGPVFMQGFIDGEKVRFFDPGLRFPGIEYDRMYEIATDINICKALISFSLTGSIPEQYKFIDPLATLNGKAVMNLFIPICPGTITDIRGIDEVQQHKSVVKMFTKYAVGDTVGSYWNVNQRFCEIDMVCDSRDEAGKTIDWIYETLQILDENGQDMKIAQFDTNILKGASSK